MRVAAKLEQHRVALQTVFEVITFGGFAYTLMFTPLTVASVITTVTSLGFKVWGQPAQILQLYRRKSSEGIPWITYAIATVSYTSWCVYGLRTGSWVIVTSQFLGVIGSFLTLHLVLQYRSNPPVKHGFLFWVWDNNHDRWQKASLLDYIHARDHYLTATSPFYARAEIAPRFSETHPNTPWYWAAQYAGRLLQGTVTDANVPENPSSQEIFDGVIRLCESLKEEKTWTQLTLNSPLSPSARDAGSWKPTTS